MLSICLTLFLWPKNLLTRIKARNLWQGTSGHGISDKYVCWTEQSHFDTSDGGGVQDQACKEATQQAVQNSIKQTSGSLPRRPKLPRIRHNGPEDFNSHLYQILNSTDRLLTSPSLKLAKNCWLWRSLTPLYYEATPVPDNVTSMVIPGNMSRDNISVTIGPTVTDRKRIGQAFLCFKDQWRTSPIANLTTNVTKLRHTIKQVKNKSHPSAFPLQEFFF